MAIRKLKLDADTLQVQSFEPAPVQEQRGTVAGYSGQFGPDCVSVCPNCNINSSEHQDSGVYGPACRSEWPNCN